jgi:peroxiredoxin
MSEPAAPAASRFAGRIGITLLCIYLLMVTVRIGGCYAPDAARRDELPGAGPAVGEPFPDFRLRDVSGATIGRDDLRGATAVVLTVPSLDWSPPTKARLIDLADAVVDRHDVRVAVVMTAAQATPRALRFVRDRTLPFYFLVDDAGVINRLGLATPAPDGTAAALPATFVLDADGRVRLRDVRKNARTWLAPNVVLDARAPAP